MTVLAKTLPYIALVSLIGCGAAVKDKEGMERLFHREQFINQYLSDSTGLHSGCLSGTNWDIGNKAVSSTTDTYSEASKEPTTRVAYVEHSYADEDDIVIVYSGVNKVPPLVFRAEDEDGSLIPDAKLTQQQLDEHGC